MNLFFLKRVLSRGASRIHAFASVLGISLTLAIAVAMSPYSSSDAMALDYKEVAAAQPDAPAGQPPDAFPQIFQSDWSTVDFSSHLFSAMMWVAGIGVGIASFMLFFFLNKKLRYKYDWILPLLPVLLLGYVIVFSPTWVADNYYERWSDKCLNAEAAPSKRVPDDPKGSDAACKRAQLDHGALGYSTVISAYRNNILNGSGEMLTPGELKGLAWLLLVFWSGAIYFILLTIRNRFFVR